MDTRNIPVSFKLTPEMQSVYDETQKPSGFGQHLFVTGKAGSGKTTFLKYLLEDLGRTKNVLVTAPTGVAAINAGGQTLHSTFMLPFSPIRPGSDSLSYLTKTKREILKKTEVLVIDEISMVRPDWIDAIDERLRMAKGRHLLPFGGVQVVMFGDPFQLPPVIKPEDWKYLSLDYEGPFFFNAKVWEKTSFRAIEFTKVFRQANQEFVDLLNRVRRYTMSKEDMDTLAKVSVTGSATPKKVTKEYTETCVSLCTHRGVAQAINQSRMGTEGLETFKARVSGKFPESGHPCPAELTLRVGARVMSLVNNFPEGYYNGSLGSVTEIDLPGKRVKVALDSGTETWFYEHTWDNNEYEIDGRTIRTRTVGQFTQIPLSPAWAITIHKSQGLTFDKVFLYIDNVFSPGQLYVALSRCRTLDGLATNIPVTEKMVIPESGLLWFEERLEDSGGIFFNGSGRNEDPVSALVDLGCPEWLGLGAPITHSGGAPKKKAWQMKKAKEKKMDPGVLKALGLD